MVTPGHHIKEKILKLFNENPDMPIYKLGFLNNWKQQPIWIDNGVNNNNSGCLTLGLF